MMTPDELIEHADNVESLLVIKRHQLRTLKIDSIARQRHELAIDALADRVAELRTAAERLRSSDLPTLQLQCVRPGVPPEIGVSLQPEGVRDLSPSSRDLCA